MKNKTIENKILKYSKKLKAISYLGGNCKNCNEDNIFKLTFHHIDSNIKDFKFSSYGSNRWSFLKKELDKCILLCQNCHRELHFNIDVKKDDRRKDKTIYLEYSGGKCIICGYNKCPASLTFHHRNPEEKEFWIGGLSERMNSISDLRDIIKNEIEKCDLLCANCHILEHSDMSFYLKNIDIIEKRSKEYKEIQGKINRDKVLELYSSGMKQKDIALYFNASNGTISDIIKKIKGDLLNDGKEVSLLN